MLKISDETIEIISDGIVDLIRQGRLLKDTAEGGGGWQGKENLEVLWHNYIKRVDPHEKKYIGITNSMLTRQAKEVFDKIKKYPNNYNKWMFDRKKWLREFTEAEAKFIVKLYKQEGQKAIDLALKLSRKSYYKAEEIPISIAFDVYNPEVTSELLRQTRRFPAGVVGTSEEIIRREIANGLELGESIDKLRKRVTERLGPTYIKNRAEMIARSETIYASNAGAELGYMQSGVVEGKKWLTAIDERTCFPCTDMNNMTAPLGQPTWEKEGLNIGEVQGKYGLDFDYTEGAMPFPPLHPRCRCTIIPIVERVEVFKPAETIKEAEKYAKKLTNENFINVRGQLALSKYGRISLDNANMINEKLYSLIREYKIKPDFIGSSQEFNKLLKELYPYKKIEPIKVNIFAQTVNVPQTKQSAITFNEKFFKKGAKPLLQESLDFSFNTGYHQLKNIEHIVDHEYAHIFDATKKISIKNNFVEEYQFLKDRGLVKTMISGYAEGDGLTESWAELFAMYKADKLPPLRKKLVEELLK